MPRTIGDGVALECGRGEAEHTGRVRYAVERGGGAHGLEPLEIQCLQHIAVGDQTWTLADDLARAGLNGPILSGLVEASWVEEFATADGRAVTLSAWSAEVLGLDPDEHWEVRPGVVDQEDSSGERTTSRVREPHEIARWDTRPPPREPGMPKPRKVPIKLPFLYHLSRLPEEVIQGLKARSVPTPVDEAIAREEFLMEQARLDDGRLDVDPESGAVREVPIVLFGQKVPREKAGPGKKSKKKRRRRRPA